MLWVTDDDCFRLSPSMALQGPRPVTCLFDVSELYHHQLGILFWSLTRWQHLAGDARGEEGRSDVAAKALGGRADYRCRAGTVNDTRWAPLRYVQP